jgi:hypothetical protein
MSWRKMSWTKMSWTKMSFRMMEGVTILLPMTVVETRETRETPQAVVEVVVLKEVRLT